MYHVTIYRREARGDIRPSLYTPASLAALFALIYEAGQHGDGVIVQEFTCSDQYGDQCELLWESEKQS